MLALAHGLPADLSRVVLPAYVSAELRKRSPGEDREHFLAHMAEHLPRHTVPAVLEILWDTQMDYGLTGVLAALFRVPDITAETWKRVLELASERTRTGGDTRYLLYILACAPVALQQTTPQLLYRALHSILHSLARSPRREVLNDLGTLEPALRALGGVETVMATISAALEIGRWWP
jgi:hypothetical protein